MSNFSDTLFVARNTLRKGGFREAFKLLVDVPVNRPDELFEKIALMADSGVALRDGSIIKYGLYLMERHAQEILAVPAYAPFHWFNLANLRINLLALREAEGGSRPWYDRQQTAPARDEYCRAVLSAKEDEKLKSSILAAHGRLLLGLGRDWEAFELFHEAMRRDSDNLDARCGRLETLAALSGTAPMLEHDLLCEVREELQAINGKEKGIPTNEKKLSLEQTIKKRLSSQEGTKKILYPRNTVLTQTDREHSMVMFSLQNKLYLNPCTSCRRCDRAIGDSLELGANHVVIGEKNPDRYRKMAFLVGRLKERYVAMRMALVHHDYARNTVDTVLQSPAVAGWQAIPPATVGALVAMAGSATLMEGMAAYLALFLRCDFRGPASLEQILGSPGTARTQLIEKENPALHGFWDLWVDGCERKVAGAEILEWLSAGLSLPEVEKISLDREQFTEKAVAALYWIRNLLGYLVRMIDREASGEVENPPLWPLQGFILPP